MMVTIFLFTVMDAIAKGLAKDLHTIQVVWARYSAQTLVATILLAPRLHHVLKTNHLGLQLIRSGFLFAATMCFFFGIVLVGLADASAIMALNPMLITLGAALILGESLGLRRAVGVSIGLIGALVIIRPGSDVFTPAALLPAMAALCYAGYTISTRFLGRNESVWTSFLYTTLIGTLIASLIVPFFWSWPTLSEWLIFGALGSVAGIGQYALIRALSLAEAGAIAPVAYMGVPLASLWGMLFFDEYPDKWVLLGALIIVGAGIYVWQREFRLSRRARKEQHG